MDGVRLTEKFSERWEGNLSGIKGAIRSNKPLKRQVDLAVRQIERQVSRINGYIEYYTRRDKELSEKILQAYENHDEARAKIFANELAEIRKHKDLLMASKMSLDKAALRLRTIYEFGNFMSIVCSAREVVQNVRSSISSLVPGISPELNHIEGLLNDIILNTRENMDVNLNLNVESEEAEKILEEASMIVESKIKMNLPDSPKEPNERASR